MSNVRVAGRVEARQRTGLDASKDECTRLTTLAQLEAMTNVTFRAAVAACRRRRL